MKNTRKIRHKFLKAHVINCWASMIVSTVL